MEKDVLLEFSMFPLDKGPSLSHHVSKSLNIIHESGLDYKLSPMGTTIEGSWNEILEVLTSCFNKMKEDCDRVAIHAKMDYRKGSSNRITMKVKSIEEKLGKELNK